MSTCLVLHFYFSTLLVLFEITQESFSVGDLLDIISPPCPTSMGGLGSGPSRPISLFSTHVALRLLGAIAFSTNRLAVHHRARHDSGGRGWQPVDNTGYGSIAS